MPRLEAVPTAALPQAIAAVVEATRRGGDDA